MQNRPDPSPAALRAELERLADPAYRAFSSGLLPGVDNLLGVRLPALRRLAGALARGDWRAYLDAARDDSFEETLLQGFVIGLAAAEPPEILARAAAFVPKIANWSICDSFCSSLKLAAREPELVWAFLQPYLADRREFSARFGVVMLLFYYLDDAHIEEALARIAAVRAEGYYADMAVAWALSAAYGRYPDLVLPLLRDGAFSPFVRNKAIQKIGESRCVSPAGKARAKALRG